MLTFMGKGVVIGDHGSSSASANTTLSALMAMIVIERSAALGLDGFINKELSQVVRIAQLKCIGFFFRF